MYMQTIHSKKETNYHRYNCSTLFCSSMACVIAFREKNITRKRSPILIAEQFLYIRLLVRSCRNARIWGDRLQVIDLCADVSRRDEKRKDSLYQTEHSTLFFPSRWRKRICRDDVWARRCLSEDLQKRRLNHRKQNDRFSV